MLAPTMYPATSKLMRMNLPCQQENTAHGGFPSLGPLTPMLQASGEEDVREHRYTAGP